MTLPTPTIYQVNFVVKLLKKERKELPARLSMRMFQNFTFICTFSIFQISGLDIDRENHKKVLGNYILRVYEVARQITKISSCYFPLKSFFLIIMPSML